MRATLPVVEKRPSLPIVEKRPTLLTVEKRPIEGILGGRSKAMVQVFSRAKM